MKKVYFAFLIFLYIGIYSCGGGGGGGGASSISYRDGTSIKTLRATNAGDYSVKNFSGTLTRLSDSTKFAWSGIIREDILASTKTIGGVTAKINRMTITQTVGTSSSGTTINDIYFLDTGGDTKKYGMYDYFLYVEKLITSPSAGYAVVAPGIIDAGSNWSYSYTYSNGETVTASYNVIGQENVSVSIGNYTTYKANCSYTTTQNSINATSTVYIIPAFGGTIKEDEQGIMTLNGVMYSYSISTELTETNISF